MTSLAEKQSNGRYILVQSAKLAKLDGFSRDEWENSDELKEVIDKYNISADIIEHIGSWVWTFKK